MHNFCVVHALLKLVIISLIVYSYRPYLEFKFIVLYMYELSIMIITLDTVYTYCDQQAHACRF